MNEFLADPRRRNLSILGAAALVSLLLAVLALHEQAASVAPKTERTEFLPGFASKVRQAAKIHIASKKNGAFDVVFKPSRGWVIPAKSDYPASFAEVNKTLVTLAALQTIEPKTARADWLHTVALDAPPKGDGTEIAVSDDHGHALARLIVGKSEDIGDSNGAVGLFVRRPDETQSWLARAESEVRTAPAEWLDKTVAAIDQTRIQSTAVNHPDGASFEVSKATNKEPHFKLSALPAGRELSSEEAPDEVATAVSAFAFDDVKKAQAVDFANPVRLITRTFDGLSLTVETVKVGDDYWARISAQSLSAKPEVAKEARTINTRANGWAYKLSDGERFAATVDKMLKPKGGQPAMPGGMPGLQGMQGVPGGDQE